MATHYEVLGYLRPNGGYVSYGDNYEGINFIDCEPFSENEYKAAFNKFDKHQEQIAQEKADKKAAALAKLENLGLDIDDLKALGLG